MSNDKLEQRLAQNCSSSDADSTGNLLNPYGEYVIRFANNHGISVSEASEHAMVKARFDYFNETGQ